MTGTLADCPFCGAPAVSAKAHDESVFVGCSRLCGILLRGFKTPAAAISAWNRRAIPAAPSDVAAIYVPMPLNADGDGPADRAETVRVEHQIWDAQTNTTLFTAADEAVAQHIVALWNGDAAALIKSLSLDREVMREALERIAEKTYVRGAQRTIARAALASLKGGAK